MAQRQPQAGPGREDEVSGAHHKTLSLRQKSAGTPTEAQLSAIRAYTMRDFGADELVVREYALAHNCIDRDKECFDEALLADFAATLPGKGVFLKHPLGWDGDTGPGEGRVYAARLEQMGLEEARAMLREPKLALPPDRSTVSVLMADAFYAKTPDNASLLIKMDAGIAADVSVSFNASERNRIKGPDGIELNAWRWVGPGEALEMSLVWLGAQPGARATKSAPRTEDTTMTLQEQLDAEKAKTAQIQAELDQLKAAAPTADAIAGVKTALGSDATLVDNPAQLAALVSAGKSHRKSLVDRLVAADRMSGELGDDEAAIKAAGEEYDQMPTAALERLAARASKAVADNGGSQLDGADPNAAKPTGKAATGVFANPLISGAAASATA